jgi:hypothetical protein
MATFTIQQTIETMQTTASILREKQQEFGNAELSSDYIVGLIIAYGQGSNVVWKKEDFLKTLKDFAVPKKRGRPPKKVVEEVKTSVDEPVEEVKIPKKRGRPPKKVVEEVKTSDDEPEEDVKIPKKRGRPPKKVVEEEKTSDDEEVKIPKKRGRPPKKVVEGKKTSDDEPAKEVKVPKKRGRPPKKVAEEENISDEDCGYCPGCEAGTGTKHSYDNNCYYVLDNKIEL